MGRSRHVVIHDVWWPTTKWQRPISYQDVALCLCPDVRAYMYIGNWLIRFRDAAYYMTYKTAVETDLQEYRPTIGMSGPVVTTNVWSPSMFDMKTTRQPALLTA